MVYLAGHAGEGHYLLHAIDPSVTDEDDPVVVRSRRWTSTTPRNGFVEPPDEPRYDDRVPRPVPRRAARPRRADRRAGASARRGQHRRHAQRGRNGRGTTTDRRRAIATDFLHVYRTDADPRAVDRSLDPSDRDYGSIWGRRPDWINYGAVGFGRVVSPEAWLSTWSGLSSQRRDRGAPGAA